MGQDLEQYRRVYNMLEDEESKDIYLDQLNFWISFKSKYINHSIRKYSANPEPMNRKTFADVLEKIPRDRKIVLYGAGKFPEHFINEWKSDKRIIGFCSNNVKKQKAGFLGYPVMSPEELFADRNVSVLVSTTAARDEIVETLSQNGFPKDKIYTFPDIKDLWEDPDQYFPEDIIQLDEEVFVDAGCYNLSTSLALRERCKSVKKVYAFEPDPVSFQRCQKRKLETNFVQAEILPFGTWSEDTELAFCGRWESECAYFFGF